MPDTYLASKFRAAYASWFESQIVMAYMAKTFPGLYEVDAETGLISQKTFAQLDFDKPEVRR